MMSYFATTVLASSMLFSFVIPVSEDGTDEGCKSPTSNSTSIERPEERPENSSVFELPVRLEVAGEPLNQRAKKMFPSPAIFDVDGDGKDELVIGSLMGDVGVHENLNASGKGDPVWGQWKALKDGDGKSIRTSNW